MKKEDYTKYAEELLNNFLKPDIEEFCSPKQSDLGIILHADNCIDIVLNSGKGITEDDIDFGQYEILTIYDTRNDETRSFAFEIVDGDIGESGFCITKPDNFFIIKNHWFYADNDLPELETFDDVSKIVEILKPRIVELYKHDKQVKVHTEKEYQIQEVSKLYAEIADIKEEYNLSEKDLTNAKANCEKWLGSI